MQSLSRLRTLAAAIAFVVLISGSTAISSLFVIYRSRWGLTPADVAMVFSAYAGTLVPALLLFGGFADRYGRRRMAAAGILFMLAGLATLLLAHDLRLLILARCLQGIGAGLGSSALAAAFTESYRGRLAPGSALQSWTAIGLAAGPVITAIAYNLGAGINGSYVPMLVLELGVLALTPLFKKPAAAGVAGSADDTPLPPATVRPALRFAMLIGFVSWAGLSLYLSLVPSYLAAALHAGNPLVGAGAILAAQLASLIATLRLGGIAPERSGVIAPFVMLAGLVLLVAGTTTNLWALIVAATILVGSGAGVASSAAFAIAARIGAGQRARIMSRLLVAAYLGYSVPALAVGAIAARSSLATGFVAVIVVLSVLAALVPLLRPGNARTTGAGLGIARAA